MVPVLRHRLRHPVTQHLEHTDLVAGRCLTCGLPVLVGWISGVRVAVGDKPLDVELYRNALLAGRRTFRVLLRQDRTPWKLCFDTPDASDRPVTAAHPCGADRVQVLPPEPAAGPQGASAAYGRPKGGSLRPVAPADATAPSTPAEPANPRPSSTTWTGRLPLAICCVCRHFLEDGEESFSVDVPGHAMWTAHADRCPAPPKPLPLWFTASIARRPADTGRGKRLRAKKEDA